MAASLAVSALAGALAGAAIGCQGVLPEPDLERMIAQRSYRPFEAASQFADQRAMRPPPPGTIRHDRVVGDPALLEGAVDGVDVATIPVPVDGHLLARGRTRFEIVCATCHGLTGDGNSAVARKMQLRKPPSLVAADVRAFPPGRVFRIISLGDGLMPSYAAVLDVRDRWAAVAYLRALQLSQHASLAELPAVLRTEAREALR
jgi:mono/diheme cytochrome c family protein